MDELKTKVLVLKNIEYKEKDKLVTVFSLELGLINVIIKNCSSFSYKLKFAYCPFSFCEFEIIKKGELFFMKNATLIDNFYDISESYDNFVVGNDILELVLKCNKTLEPNNLLFINTLKALNILAYGQTDCKILLLKFMLGLTKVNGFKLNFKKCGICEMAYTGKIYLNLNSGEFECVCCKNYFSVLVEKEVFELLKKINSQPIDNLPCFEEDYNILKDSLKLMTLNIENRFGVRLNCKNFL